MDDSWEQIGKRLREAREKAEFSIEDVVYRARIPRTIVEALEAEDFSVFTSPTYAKSFLTQYSEFLHVDADPWLSALVPASYVSGESWQPVFATGERSGISGRATREVGRSDQATERAGAGKWSALWLIVLTSALVIAVIGGYRKFEEKFGKEDVPAAAKTVKEPGREKAHEAAAPPVTPSATPEEAAKEESRSLPPRAIIVRD